MSSRLEQATSAYLRTHPCQALIRLFLQYTFCFSFGANLKASLAEQVKGAKRSPSLGEMLDRPGTIEFSWNNHLLNRTYSILRDNAISMDNIRSLNDMNMFVTIIQGFIEGFSMDVHGLRMKIDLISRLASDRAGARMLSRGVDDDGNTSNYVEVSYRGAMSCRNLHHQ